MTDRHRSKARGRTPTHGQSRTRTYDKWKRMRQRCLNPANKDYHNYGGRGITICGEWAKFENFLADMGDAPPELTLERVDNNKGYCKANCVWATTLTQNRNKRSAVYLEFKGERLSIADWTRKLGLKHKLLYLRLRKGWHLEKCLTSKLYRTQAPTKHRPKLR